MKEHPTLKGYFATEEGKIYNKEGRFIKPVQSGTRLKFTVNSNRNYGYRRFIWEAMTGKEVEKGKIVNNKFGDRLDNQFKNLQCITKSEHASQVYKEIWRKKKGK